ncbi:MAG: alpha-L-arabinofuranosidase C-terminal domain-containing protein [Terriglobia bacterium]
MRRLFLVTAALFATTLLWAQAPIEIQISADKPGVKASPSLYGLMTEEINYSYEGGIYAELIRNRSMKEDPKDALHWSALKAGAIALDPSVPLNDAIATSLKLTASAAGDGIANDGFWGIPVHPGTRYHASFYAKAAPGFTGPLTIAIVSNDGSTVQATAQVPGVTSDWRKYSAVLTTAATAKAGPDNKFTITVARPGTVWFSMVSLFPPTYKNRPNGNRADIMQLLADMHPSFLRFPGGNYLEGNTIETRFDWKKTLGPVNERPGHMNDGWKYWSSDGMGLLEFLNWCEDLHMQPLLAVYAGYSMRQIRVAPGPDLDPYVKEALEEIEYVTGAANTTWGARRAKDGHPAPFKLEYVEIGNEDSFDRQAGSYDGRFTQFYDAIKKAYPRLQIIATTKVTTRQPDLLDEHYYRNSEEEMASHAHDYDARPRTGPKVFVGEWATRVGDPTPNMSAALGDAAWMIGMERNSDLVLMSCYAPLFVNVNKGAMQWRTDLIGYDTMTSYGSPAYWAQQMFSSHYGDTVLPIAATGIPEKTWQPAPRRGRGDAPPPPAPPAVQVPLAFFNATRDSKTGTVYLKVVNRAGTAQPVKVSFSGLKTVETRGQAITLSASSPDDTNTITEPRKLVPVTSAADQLGKSFTRNFPPYSITVLELKTK